MPHTRRDFLQMLGAGAPLAALPGVGQFSASLISNPHEAARYTAAAFQLASGELPGAFKLSNATLVGATQIDLTPAPYAPIEDRAWVIIDPFTAACEIRRVVTISGSTIEFSSNPGDMRPLEYAHPQYAPVLYAYDLVITPELFGAKVHANDLGDDHAAITAAIAQAKLVAGLPGSTGAEVFLSGSYGVSAPILLPRTVSNDPANVVQLRGANVRSTRLVAIGSSWSAGDAVVMWAVTMTGATPTPTRAWHQRISNLTIVPPEVAGTHAIRYHLVGSPTNVNEMLDERLQLVLQDVLVQGKTDFNTELIRLEGNLIDCVFERVAGDPDQGPLTNNSAVLIVTDTEDYGYSSNDAGGFSVSTLRNLQAGLRSGGYIALFQGRMMRSKLDSVYAGTGTTGTPIIHLINSYQVKVDSFFSEGRAETPQILLQDSQHLTLQDITLGVPAPTVTSVRTSAYRWQPSALGTNEFFLQTSAGGNPNLPNPSAVTFNGSFKAEGAPGSLDTNMWGYGDNDALGYSTLYVRLADNADPDSKAEGWVSYTALTGMNGIELENVRDSWIDNIPWVYNKPPFHYFSANVLVLDADCQRNTFTRIGLGGDLEEEIQVLAPATAKNYFEAINTVTGEEQTYGRRVGDAPSRKTNIGALLGLYQSLPRLRGFWPLNLRTNLNLLHDMSGFGHHLSNNGSTAFGMVGSYITYADFNGASQSLSIADNANLSITSDLTFGAWIRADAFVNGTYSHFMGKWLDTGSQGAYSLAVKGVNSTTLADVGLFVADTNGTPDTLSNTDLTAHRLSTGKWYLIVGRYNASGSSSTLKLNVNLNSYTKLVGSITALKDSTAAFALGAMNGTMNWFDGQIALPFVCGTDLSDTVVAELYEQGRHFFG